LGTKLEADYVHINVIFNTCAINLRTMRLSELLLRRSLHRNQSVIIKQ